MRVKTSLSFIVSISFFFASLTAHAVTTPRGWSNDYITMSSISEGEQNAFNYDLLKTRFAYIPANNVSIFTYANGGDDTWTISTNHKNILSMELTKVSKAIAMARDLEKQTNKKVMPVLVVYTSGGSASTDSMDIDFGLRNDPKNPYLSANLKYRLIDLITVCQQIENTKDADHPFPATIVLNPDFLGEAHKIYTNADWAPQATVDSIKAIDPAMQAQGHIPLKTTLDNAYNEMGIPEPSLPDFITDNGNVSDYLQTLNWIVKTYAPDVVFGWEDAIWAGDPAGHKWIHHPEQLNDHINSEVNFLKLLKVYDSSNPYQPDFFSFDKYERDDFDGNDNSLNNGYLYNLPAWNTYFNFIAGVSQQMGNLPIMLFQYQGGHLQITDDLDARHLHGATGATYLLGDPLLTANLANIDSYISVLKFASPVGDYNTSDTSVMDYLNMADSTQNRIGWNDNHIAQLHNANVFAILWGGGNTTSIAGLSAETDDNQWLTNAISGCYLSGWCLNR